MYKFQLSVHLAAVKGRVTAVLAERTQFQIPAAALWQKRLTEARIWSADLVHFLSLPAIATQTKTHELRREVRFYGIVARYRRRDLLWASWRTGG